MDGNYSAQQLYDIISEIRSKVSEIVTCTNAFNETTTNISTYIRDGSENLGNIWAEIGSSYQAIGLKMQENSEALTSAFSQFIARSNEFDQEFEQGVEALSGEIDELENELASL